jgi:predicted DNA repair protein MutK
MFLVGGGILVHGIAPLHHWRETQGVLIGLLADGAVGIAAGALVLGIVMAFRKAWRGT